jgi:bacteriophage N4 adsorption protein B
MTAAHKPMETYWTFLFVAREELLLFSAFWIILAGIDDLVLDVIWAARAIWRKVTRYRSTPPLRADQLGPPRNSGLLVVFVPAWQESAVIGRMLTHCLSAWSHCNVSYRIYVGCYPNDVASVKAVIAATGSSPNVQMILCDHPGPTTKADCLNQLWHALTSDELAAGYKAKAVILHDAEDFVHAAELQLFDYLIERGAAVQLPVIPVQVPNSAWVSGHYGDEFAEAHGKSLVVREALGAAVPLAGVGCAIERNHLGRIAIERGGDPFDDSSLTEDYELGLALGSNGGKVIFARIQDTNGSLVGTRACFPATFKTATRQKARWMIGIALAGWDRLGWQGGFVETWMRLRDRKAVFSAIVLTTAYLSILLSIILMIATLGGLFKVPASTPIVQLLVFLTLIVLLWRIVIRAAFVWLMHGPTQAALSVPRTLVANMIAIIAARNASWSYLRHLFGAKLVWDKTEHTHFPEKATRNG